MPESGHRARPGGRRRRSRVPVWSLTIANRVWASGRATRCCAGCSGSRSTELVERYPGIAVHGALMFALMGEPGRPSAGPRRPSARTITGTLDDGNTIEGTVAYLRALLCRDGVDAMRQRRADRVERAEPDEPVPGDDAPHRGRSPTCSTETSTGPTRSSPGRRRRRSRRRRCRSCRCSSPTARHRRHRARRLGAEADRSPTRGRVRSCSDGRFDDYWTSALVYAWMAQGRPAWRRRRPRDGARRSGRPASAPAHLRPPGGVGPGAARDGDVRTRARRPGRRPRRAQADSTTSSTSGPRLGNLLAAGGRRCDRSSPRSARGALGASSLTTAELRLLPLLSTHLTLPEIGERLFVSRHTVKTQAISVYRKLGVSSRSEAITRMHELGLLAHA